MAITNIDIAWVAGILEGEATFHIRKPTKVSPNHWAPVIQLVMTDEDVIAKVAKMFNRKYSKGYRAKLSTKDIYRVNLYGLTAFGITQTIYGLMSSRRQAQIRLMWEAWSKNPRWKGGSV
jgi:hypothetical protein